jgi:hypothetical protein
MPDITGDGVNDFDITPSGSSVTIGGVTFTDAVNTGSGTGNYNTFLAISNNSGVESGFNSDDTPPIDASNHDIDQAKTHTVKLSDLVIVTVNGQQYYEFRVDLNEANSDPNAQISLDQFKLYSSTNGGINDTTTLFGQNLIYDMDAGANVSVLLSDAESSGSGNDDYAVLVPVSEFAGLDPTTTYVYLYTQMGAAGANWNATATFEEWNLQNGVTLTGTKFDDLNSNGLKDAGEGPIAGVTIFIDANHNGILDAGERSTVTDASGNYTFYGVGTNQTVWIDEVVPAGATQTTGDHEEVIVSANATPGSTIVVDPIGNHLPVPDVHLEKDATVPGGSADSAGEVISYTLAVSNPGEVALTGIVITDPYADAGSIQAVLSGGFNVGDTDQDNQLDLTETWSYTATHTVTQAEIDSNGGGNGELENTATVNTDQGVSDDDDASVPIDQNPSLAIDKNASVDGDCADTVGELVNYTIDVTNNGNVSLENVVVTDDLADLGSIAAVDLDADGFNDGDTDADGQLDVGETWNYTAYHTVTQDDIDAGGNYDSDADGTNDSLRNIAAANATAVTSGEAADEVTDDAVVDVCQNPSLAIDKNASVDGDCADTVGELVNYTIDVTNNGNVSLENVVVTDDLADLGSIAAVDLDADGFNDGDADLDGQLDVGETWNYTAYHTVTQADIDAGGNYDSDADGTNDSLRNIAAANATAVTSGEVADEVTDDAVVEVCQNPSLAIDKNASVDGDCADTVGELVNYTIDVTNDGNVALENVVVTDDLADLGSIAAVDLDADGFNDGDTDADGVLDVGETWNYTAYHTVTQADIDAGGNYDSDADGTNDSLRNIAAANATAVVSGEAADEVTDDAVVEVCQNPAIDLEKYVAVDSTDGTDGTFVDADDALGPQNVNLGADVWFKVTVENTGNTTLTDVDISDVNQTGGGSLNFDLVVDGALTADAVSNHSASLDGDLDSDGFLDVGETWTITYRQAFDPGEHVNTATVTTDEGATDNDAAHYFSLVDEGLCPRTPGFWQNPKNGGQFWDGIQGNEKHAGEAGFPDGELLYAVDSNNNGSIGAGDVAGLLIGDYNKNGLTDAGEDTLFVSYADARSLINASNKQVGGDGRFMLGRDMVASWLNYLQGSGFGDASDTHSPTHYLDDSIDWMQIFSGTLNGGTGETFDRLNISGGAVKTSSAIWNSPQSGIDHSASQMHSALDYYNNTGQTEAGGTHYANCESQHLFEALSIYQQSHELV